MQNSYNSSLKHLNLSFGNSKLSAISPKMISEYKVLRKSEGVKPATINRELAMFSKAFNLAVKEWEWIKDNPVSKVPKEKEDNERDRWLIEDEEKRLLENSPEWLKDIILFLSSTGTKIDRHNLRRAFNIALGKADTQGFHFHDLNFATRLVQKGVVTKYQNY